jgi:glycosyltransferase involved in cell wall biosynthesis
MDLASKPNFGEPPRLVILSRDPDSAVAKPPSDVVVSTKTNPRPGVRLVSLTTSAMSGLWLQAGQLSFLRENGIDVIAVASPGPQLRQLATRDKITVFAVPMSREMSPIADFVSLVRLWRLFRILKPEIVNAGTPKAGLLGMIAAYLAGVPVRVYTQRGLRLETCSGWRLRLLTMTERLACFCADRVLFVSPSLRATCLERKLVHEAKALVIGSGSSNGVNAERIISRRNAVEVRNIAARYGIAPGAPVVGFVGRLTRDKGVRELAAAFALIRHAHPGVRLLVVGDFEDGDPVAAETISALKSDPDVSITGFVNDASPYYHVMSVLAFPSHREGFPNVPLEAACAGLPTVGFAATGVVDAIQHGVTGTVVTLGDVAALASAIITYLADDTLRQRHGTAAKERALRDFPSSRIWMGLLDLYRERLQAHGIAWNRAIDPRPAAYVHELPFGKAA